MRVPLGIIPARAGFTSTRHPWPRPYPDHPRSRGVYAWEALHPHTAGGSSPLARGLHAGGERRRIQDRIIPARAGFTDAVLAHACPPWDHPRSRGVYVDEASMAATIPGSSPLARGLRLGGPAPSHGRRIIPARAGFTVPRAHMWTARRDHPRSRGVYRDTPVSRQICRGSSPLARGLLHNVPTFNRPTRIIPARAGFTFRIIVSEMNASDHPRSRGVYNSRSGVVSFAPGSSPLARGLLPKASL